MGSFVEVNDTLQLTTEQGFPIELDFNQHKKEPLKASDFKGKTFSFIDKPRIRIYHAPPVRTFLVHNIGGKWLYRGTIHMLKVVHNLEDETTSGTFRILDIYTPEQMEQAFDLLDTRPEMNYFL